jgi:uncharacterized protein YuzE
MEAIKILEGKPNLSWEYDEEADVLYVSVGEPQPALGVDIGEGVILRYDEKKSEVVGLTVIGVKARLLKELGAESFSSHSVAEERGKYRSKKSK